MDPIDRRAFPRAIPVVVLFVFAAAALPVRGQAPDAVPETSAPVGDPAVSEAFRYEAHWQAQLDAEKFDEAVEVATSWINEAKVQFGDDAPETFVPMLRLAETHYVNDDPAKAVATYFEAVKVGERAFGPVSMVLVQPLLRTGQIYQQQGDNEAAISALLRAKDITHRNAGIFNVEQGPIVDMLTESFWSMGDVRQATREQRFLFGTAEKSYGPDSPDLVPALQKWALHNARIGRLSDSRQLFYEAIDILEKSYGPDDLRLVDTLYTMANTLEPRHYQENQYYPREGAIALRRAIDIYQAQEFVDADDVLTAQARLGDWYMRNDRRNKGLEVYQAAIDEARATGVDEALLDRQFGAPRLLTRAVATVGMTNSERERARKEIRKVVFEYDLDVRGNVRNVRVIEDSLGLVSTIRILRAQIKELKHRPRWVDGQRVPHFGMRYEVIFDPTKREAMHSAYFSRPEQTAAKTASEEPEVEEPTTAN